jgi:RNA polymerase sigma factor (TIGR02999 family)
MDVPRRQRLAVRDLGVERNTVTSAASGLAGRAQRSRTSADGLGCRESRCESGAGIASRRVWQAGAPLVSAAHVREVLVNEIDDSVTGLIHAWNAGDSGAGDRLFSLVYGELRSIARSLRRRTPEQGDDTLDTTALVHEVYLRLAGADELNVQNRGHFFAVAVRASRQIVSNYARNAQTLKRGGNAVAETIDGIAAEQLVWPALGDDLGERVSALEEALLQLEHLHPRPCRVVECRYFGGLSIPDTALVLGISEATVKRDWALAQAWLHRALRAPGASDDE